jgi:hypothetical protein
VRNLKRLLLTVGAIALALSFPSTVLAQFDTASVVGTVRDNTGGVVPGATVTLTNLDTGITAVHVTDENGNFEFPTVRIGRYKITAELQGFATALVDEVQLTVGARQRIEMKLNPGQVSETIEVVGAATRLETDSSARGQVITSEQAVELPLNGREYSMLVMLSPGVRNVSSIGTGSSATAREGSFNVNGLRSTFNNYLLDGLDNNAYGTSNQGFSNQVMQPSPDAVAEFRVVTNNMSAEYGRSAGATINVATRSGTNNFRGAAWEFYRDTALNAFQYPKPASGQKPPLERNQFGGAFGGPLVRNRAFFFGEYEGFRQTRGLTTTQTLPTMVQRQGILSVDVRNPITGAVHPAGTPIPMTALARKVLSELVAPTNANASSNYVVLQEFTRDEDKGSGKVDFQVSPALTLFGRYGHRELESFDQPPMPLPSGGSGNGTTYVTNKQFATGFTWTRTGTSLLEGRFGWSDTVAGKNPSALGTTSALDAYGITGLPNDPRVAGGLPTTIITGYADLGRQATNPQWQYPTMWNPKVNYTWVTGRHSLKAGYEFQHIQTEVQDVNPLYGRDTYGGQLSRPAGAAANNVYNLADFMLGLRSRYELSNILIANLRQQMHFTYFQDDFRVNDRLTLNLGLRYEYATPHWEKDNILSNWDPDTQQMIFASDGSLADRALIDPDRNNWAPRLGFAYTLTPRTVARGGYGMSYIHFHRAGGANILSINGPQVINAVVNQTNPTDPNFRTTQQGYPAGLNDPSRFVPTAANITYMPRDYHSSRVQSYYLSVQREIASNMILDVAYVGNRADDLLLFANFNQATPNNAAGSIPLAQRRPIPAWGDITYSFNGGKSRYNSLQVKYEYRMRRGLMMLNSFTWSKAKDNGSGSLENSNGNNPAPQDFRNLEADYGTSNYDQPLNNTTSFVYDLPFGRGRRWLGDANAVAEAFLGGWTLSGISTASSGEPVTLTYTPVAAAAVSGITADFRGANNYRPNVNGSPYGDKGSTTNYLNRANVSVPPVNEPFGNAPRNSVRAPAYWTFDLVASKDFVLPVGDQTRIQFRIETFNLFNRTNYRAPVANLSSAAFGQIQQAYDARQIQLGVKVMF